MSDQIGPQLIHFNPVQFEPYSPQLRDSRVIYRGTKLTLRVDTLQLPDRAPGDIEIIEHPGSAMVIPFTDNDEIVMVRQWRPAIGQFTLELPSGTREQGETPIETAQRELREETGYRARHLEPLRELLVAPGYSQERCHIFVAKELEKSPLPQDKLESILALELKRSDVLQISGRLIKDSLTIAALMLGLLSDSVDLNLSADGNG